MFRLRMLPVTLLLGLLLAFSVAAACEEDSGGGEIASGPPASQADADQEPVEPEPTNTPTEQEECEDAGGIWHDHTFTPRDADCHPATPTPEPTEAAADVTGDQEPAEPEPTNTPTEQEECEEAGGTWHNHYFSFRDADCHPATPTPEPTDTPVPPPPPTDTPVPPPPPMDTPVVENCDRQSYPNVCIPPYPPDLNCGDIPHRRFTVHPPDPHGFDGDNDGIGCESG